MARETLMLSAWNTLSPDKIKHELDRAMARMGVDEKFFTLKTLTRIVPFYEEKFKNPNYYENKNWTHAKSLN